MVLSIRPRLAISRSQGGWEGRVRFAAISPRSRNFPREIWARLVARHARRMSPRQMMYGDDRELAVRAAQSGISVVPLSACYAGPARDPGLVLGYGTIRATEIAGAVRKLKALLPSQT